MWRILLCTGALGICLGIDWLSCGNSDNVLERCPPGYVLVPADRTLGTEVFCVAAYEMKRGNAYAVSRASGLPWANIDALAAYEECGELRDPDSGLDEYTGDFALISNDEWMAVARNIEKHAL